MKNEKALENTLDLMVKRAKYVMHLDHKNTEQTRMVLYGFTQYYSALYDVTTSHILHTVLDDIWSSVHRYLRFKQDYANTIREIDNAKEIFKAFH